MGYSSNLIDEGYTAILVDGGFYKRRAHAVFGEKKPEERADELDQYCKRHLKEKDHFHHLYRIFYYDCQSLDTHVFHPFTRKQIDLKKSDEYKWENEFFEVLKCKRKFALRFGKLNARQAKYTLDHNVVKKLCSGDKTWADVTEKDFKFSVDQKGVDMKIGLDIASMAYKKQVSQIVLISGDSDFVAAAKLARREGIDFILDPLGASVKEELREHVDGLRTCDSAYKK